MFTWGDAFRIAAMVVVGVGGVGTIIGGAAKILADSFANRIAAKYQRETETMLAEVRARLDQGAC